MFDYFHVIRFCNDKLSDLRRSLYHRAEADQKKVLKGSRWLLLKNPENLDADKDEKARLEEAMALNKPLATAKASGVKMLQQMARTPAAHRSGLLADDGAMITSRPMEGTNNKLKTMKRRAYGFRAPEFFKPKILAIHEI